MYFKDQLEVLAIISYIITLKLRSVNEVTSLKQSLQDYAGFFGIVATLHTWFHGSLCKRNCNACCDVFRSFFCNKISGVVMGIENWFEIVQSIGITCLKLTNSFRWCWHVFFWHTLALLRRQTPAVGHLQQGGVIAERQIQKRASSHKERWSQCCLLCYFLPLL